MYSTNNTNKQQQEGRQAPNIKPDPDGNKYTITIEDTIHEDGSQGIVIHTGTVKHVDRRTAAYYATNIINRTINSGITTILEAVAEALSNQEGKR